MKSIAPERINGIAATANYARFYRDPAGCMDRMYARYGPEVCLGPGLPFIAHQPEWLFLMGAKYNRPVLDRKQVLRPRGLWPIRGPKGSAQNNLKNNLLRLHGPVHSHFNDIIRPMLSRPNVVRHVTPGRDMVRDELDNWPVGETADIVPLVRRLTQRLSLPLLFDEPDRDRAREIFALVDRYHYLNWSPRAQLNRTRLIPGLPYDQMIKDAEQLQDMMIEWAEERRGCPATDNLRSAICNAAGLDGEPLTPETIAAQLAGMVLASYETQASALCWTLFLLAQHPQVMADLLDELAVMTPPEVPDAHAFEAAPMVDWVIKESMRLVTPVPMICLQVCEDFEIFDRKMRRKSSILLSPHITHRDPDIYKHPDRFLPERWSKIRPSSYEFMPFSAGTRRCPGFWFASNNLRIMLTEIVQRYRLTVAPGARIGRRYAATTVPNRGIPMEIAKQDRQHSRSPIRGSILELVNFDTGVDSGKRAQKELNTVH